MQTATIAILAIVMFSSAAYASDDAQEDRDERRGPPKQAVEACASMIQGDPCDFEGRRGSVSGTCEAPADKPLACMPEGGRPKHKLERREDATSDSQ